MARLQSADRLLAPAVAETLAALHLGDEDTAAANLARQYAQTIDDAEDTAEALEKLGPKLLAALESLGATPKGRAALKKEASGAQGESKLAQLRAARAS